MKQCRICGSELTGLQRKFCSNQCKHKSHNNKHNNYVAQKSRGVSRRIKLVDMLGGKCCICEYNKCLSALCFHHVNSSDKSFRIDLRRCSNSSWEVLVKEASKCKLLCHNCHMELHYPEELSTLRSIHA